MQKNVFKYLEVTGISMNILAVDFSETQNCTTSEVAQSKLDNGSSEESYSKFMEAENMHFIHSI